MNLKEKINLLKELRNRLESPIPPMPANTPFYIDMVKPRPSLSKHDDKRPTYWHMDDAQYVLACAAFMPEIIEELEKLLN